jgi:hypothetical protein
MLRLEEHEESVVSGVAVTSAVQFGSETLWLGLADGKPWLRVDRTAVRRDSLATILHTGGSVRVLLSKNTISHSWAHLLNMHPLRRSNLCNKGIVALDQRIGTMAGSNRRLSSHVHTDTCTQSPTRENIKRITGPFSHHTLVEKFTVALCGSLDACTGG